MYLNQNPDFGPHNTSIRREPVKFIVIHYVGATGDARENIRYYNQRSTTNASADFYVGFHGDIWQYNPDPHKRFCYSVGGGRKSAYGGSLFGIAVNANCINIEMCVRNDTENRTANSRNWYFEAATVNSTVELTRFLMETYQLPPAQVIRHFDVNGKFCPGVYGWNSQTGSESAWNDFKQRIQTGTNLKGGNDFMFTCKQVRAGDIGNDVLLLEEILKARGLYNGALDRSFGSQLDAAVRSYQADRHLAVDGICGPTTWNDLIAL